MSEQQVGGPDSRSDVQRARSKLTQLIADKMFSDHLKSFQEFADRYGIGRSTLYELVRGRSRTRGAWVKPSLDTMVALARALDRPLHELIYLIEPSAPGATEAAAIADMPTMARVEVQVAGWVGAGPDQFEEILDEHAYVEQSFARGKDLRAFRIRGDSMAAGRAPIQDGDLVLVDANDKGENTASIVARIDDNGFVCKMLKDDKFGKLLQSRNVEHTNGTPTAIPIDRVTEVIGRVVRIIHDE